MIVISRIVLPPTPRPMPRSPTSPPTLLRSRIDLEAFFAAQGITYQSAQVGIYHIYYDFQPAAPRPPLAFK